jgi:hypothetical protein
VIISHKYKFIFVKTAKTAGTSIEAYLSRHCDQNDILTPIHPSLETHTARNYQGRWNPIREISNNNYNGIGRTIRDFIAQNKFQNHMKAKTIRNRISPDIWNNYYKFCVERNPWDKTISHYHMLNDRAGNTLTFDAYLSNKKFCVNHPKYTDLYGNLLVDKVIKFESLADELDEVFNMLSIPFDGSLGVRAKSEHRQDKRPYQEIFSEEQRKIISKAFAKEIELHNYTF